MKKKKFKKIKLLLAKGSLILIRFIKKELDYK